MSKEKPVVEEMDFDRLCTMVMEGLDGIEADTLVKVARVMFGAKIRWSEEKDCYLVRLPE